MSGQLAFDAMLGLLLVAAGWGAVRSRGDGFSACVFFIVLGLFAAVAWVRLGAVDVALAEAAIGAGLTGVLLVRAVPRLPAPAAGPGARLRQGAAALGALALFAALAAVLALLPVQAGLGLAVAAQLPATGLGNPVTAVLVNFRGFDTLLESVVLLAALLAIWSLCSDDQWPGRPGLRDHAHPRGVLASFARVLPPAGLLVGLHLFWAGADAPGGAFQAATILAAVWLLATLAGLARPPGVASLRLRACLLAGPVLFLAFAAAALPGGGFLVFPPEHAKAVVLALEAALTLSLAATLGLVVMGPPQGGPEAAP